MKIMVMKKTLTKAENATESVIRKNFDKEIAHSERMFELFLKSYRFITAHQDMLLSKDDYLRWSTFLLFIRNLRILRSAFHSMLNGYYEISMAIQRMGFENHLMMYFFMRKPEEAKNWWSGRRFGLRRIKREARKTLSYDQVHANLSEFIHTNFSTTTFFCEFKGEGASVAVTDYSQKHFCLALQGLLVFGVATLLIIVPTMFYPDFKDDELVKEIETFDTSSKRIINELQIRSKQAR
jgi:hypothetical protein